MPGLLLEYFLFRERGKVKITYTASLLLVSLVLS